VKSILEREPGSIPALHLEAEAARAHQALLFRGRFQNILNLGIGKRFAIRNPDLAIGKFDLADRARHTGGG
jgi:hypothetical protein